MLVKKKYILENEASLRSKGIMTWQSALSRRSKPESACGVSLFLRERPVKSGGVTASKKRYLFLAGFNEGAGLMDMRGGVKRVGGDWKLWRERRANKRKDTEAERELKQDIGDGMEDCNKKSGLDRKGQAEAMM